MEVAPIGLDVPVQETYPSYIERYFTPRYVLDTGSKEGEDVCVLFHSNRICVVVLAPSHPVLTLKKKVVEVNFETDDFNRMNNKLSGKRKRGGQFLNPNSPLCELKCDDGTSYIVRSCIPGKLIEINKHLLDHPNLITDKPSSEGYIGIVLPKSNVSDNLKDELLKPEEYQEAVKKRSDPSSKTGSSDVKSESKDENSDVKSESKDENSDAKKEIKDESLDVKKDIKEEDSEMKNEDDGEA